MSDPQSPQTAYARECAAKCEWCAKDIPLEFGFNNFHSVLERDDAGFKSHNFRKCSAPALEEFAEQQAAEAEAQRARADAAEARATELAEQRLEFLQKWTNAVYELDEYRQQATRLKAELADQTQELQTAQAEVARLRTALLKEIRNAVTIERAAIAAEPAGEERK